MGKHFIIGFFGPSGCGKSTCAKALQTALYSKLISVPVEIRSFAAPLKAALATIGIIKGHPSFRHCSQILAEAAKIHNDAFWVDLLLKDIDILLPSVIIIDDGRHLVEAPICDMSIMLTRNDRTTDISTGNVKHRSETEWVQIKTTAAFENNRPEDPQIIANHIITNFPIDRLRQIGDNQYQILGHKES